MLHYILFMRLILNTLLLFFVFAGTAFAEEAVREKTFNSQSFTLDNGMQVIVIPNHRVPVVTHMVWYKVGAADETPGKSGLAHFVEHLMFKGTDNIPPGEFSKRVKALGGQDNAFTSQDYTAYFQSVAVENLETVMTMEADRMSNARFPAEEVEAENLVILEERRQRTENEPTGYFYEQMRTMLFPNHPYGMPVIGWLHEMETLNREDAIEFYNKWYAPNNAYLIVSGDITAEQLKPLAERIYGTIPAKEVSQRSWTSVPPFIATPRLELRHPSIKQPSFVRVYRMPGYKENKTEALALDVLDSIMSDGQNGRLYKSLVIEQKLAVSTGLGYDGVSYSDTTLSISATPAESTSLETLETAIDEELRKLIEHGVTEEEVSNAINKLSDSYIFSRDSLSGPAMIFGRALISGNTIDDVEYWDDDIKTVSVEDVNNVARSYLDPDNFNERPFVSGYIMPMLENTEPAAGDE